jgi:hypothetical protein
MTFPLRQKSFFISGVCKILEIRHLSFCSSLFVRLVAVIYICFILDYRSVNSYCSRQLNGFLNEVSPSESSLGI